MTERSGSVGKASAERVRYAVVGLGGIGGLHCRFATQNDRIDLVAVADADESVARQRAEEFGVRPFSSLQELVGAGLVDAVCIATPSHVHADMAIQCLESGLHVFLEKPIALTVADADRVVEAAQRYERVLCVGHQYRVHRLHRTTKQLLERGAVGTLRRVLWTWVQLRTDSYFDRYPWRARWEQAGGGVLMHSLSHDLNVLLWLMGKPTEVCALAANQLHGIETEDIFSGVVLFHDGALATLQATIDQPQAHCVRQLVGDKGMIVVPAAKSLTFDHKDEVLLGRFPTGTKEMLGGTGDPAEQPSIEWQRVPLVGDPPKWKKLFERFGALRNLKPHGLAVLVDSFVAAIRGDGDPIVTGEDARDTLELVNALYLSSVRKRTVTIPIDRGEYEELFRELVEGRVSIPRFH